MSEKKKLSFNINSIAVTTLILFLICAIMALALAGTNYITKEKIAALDKKNQDDSLKVVLAAENYAETVFTYTNEKNQEASATYYIATNGEEISGYIFITEQKGYGGIIKVMTGIDKDGKITAVKILSASDETPGLGANVTKSDFYSQYASKGSDLELVKNAPADNQVKAVTGATISSTAVNNAVKDAFKLYSLITAEQEAEEPAENQETQAEAETTQEDQTQSEEVSENEQE